MGSNTNETIEADITIFQSYYEHEDYEAILDILNSRIQKYSSTDIDIFYSIMFSKIDRYEDLLSFIIIERSDDINIHRYVLNGSLDNFINRGYDNLVYAILQTNQYIDYLSNSYIITEKYNPILNDILNNKKKKLKELVTIKPNPITYNKIVKIREYMAKCDKYINTVSKVLNKGDL
jgi:hypothetical protein